MTGEEGMLSGELLLSSAEKEAIPSSEREIDRGGNGPEKLTQRQITPPFPRKKGDTLPVEEMDLPRAHLPLGGDRILAPYL